MKDFPFNLGPVARKAPLCRGWVAHSGLEEEEGYALP